MNRLHRYLLTAMAVAGLNAATTTTWEMTSYQDFIKGRFNGVALDRDGRLTLAPKLDSLFSSGQSVIWSLAKAPDGSIYAGTGHRGRVYRIDASGASKLIWTADQAEVFAVAVDAAGVLYAASSPDGRIYRIENGKATEIFNPKTKYIWALTFGRDGTLYAGTGDPANVYAIDKTGKGELYYSTGQGHVTSLAIDREGRLLAGSEPNGILYRVTAKDKAFVLYDTSLPEIRAIKPMPDGTIYAAALGGALSNRTGMPATYSTGATAITVTAPATSVTVTDTQANPPDVKPKAGAATATQSATQQTTTAATPAVEIPGVDKSAIYRINPDNTVETLWTSKDENIYDLALRPNGEIVFGTDVQARIYSLGADRKPALIIQANEGEATRLLESGGSLLAATGDTGKLFRLTPAGDKEPSQNIGTYESPVHDANTVARWGRITWRQHGGSVVLQTRSGNSLRPDSTWSEWSAEMRDPKNSLISSPNARYIQWRAKLSGDSPTFEDVWIAYLPQNNPPVVRSINVTTVAPSAASSQSKASNSSSNAAYTITVTDTGEAASSPSSGTPTQALSHGGGSQIQVTWQADDPDNDRLAYSLWFRGEEETTWKLIRMNMTENSFLLDGDVFADGRYYFRVVASDRPANPPNLARDAEMVSSPVMIDNTPPVVTLTAARRNGNHVEADVDAADATSPLRRCEYSVNAGPWVPVEASDGVTDAPHEKFHIVLDNVRPGEHLIVVRVFDTANNAGLAKIVVK